MKKVIILFSFIILFASCEDVIDLKLPTTKPRLVIDASINWENTTDGKNQEIKLSLSAPFFNNTIPPANGAEVFITNSSSGVIFNFIEEGDTGVYKTSNFLPELNATYELTVKYKDDIYKATETLLTTSPINRIEQDNESGITKDEISVKAFYNDPEDEKNFYFFEFSDSNSLKPSLSVYNDEFTNGNTNISITYFGEETELTKDMIVTVKKYGVSQRFYNFMNVLLRQVEGSGGGFETQPATVRGNILNTTNQENFPFGYFRLSQVDVYEYIVE